MPSGGGGGGTTTTVQKSDPWSGLQPFLTQQFGQAQNLYNNGLLAPSYYPNQTVANQSPQTQAAITGVTNLAEQPNPVISSTEQQLADTESGKYLDPTQNPGFQQALTDVQKAYSTGTAAQTDAAFNRSGAYGGSAYDETKQNQNKAYADSLNTLAGNMYQQGRQNQMQGLLTAPSVASMQYQPLSALATAGSTQDAYNQSLINADMNKYAYTANLPANSLATYEGLTSNPGGGTTTTSQPYFQNSAANNLGLGLGVLGGLNAIGGLTSGSGLLSASSMPALAAFFSDARLKENITPDGMENGIPLYTFAYKGDQSGTRYRGVMAQDILHTHPHAVIIRDGYYAINYSALGIQFRRIN